MFKQIATYFVKKATDTYKISGLLLAFFCMAGHAKAQTLPQENSQAIVQQARQQKKPYVVEMKTTWCGYCKLFERETLKNDSVIAYLSSHYLIGMIDAEKVPWGAGLSEKYKIKAFPTLLFFAFDGKLLGKMRGYQDADEFLYNLQRFQAKHDKYKRKH